MKKYISSKIKVIHLDPEQSVLQICKIGGNYFGAGTNGNNKCQRVMGGPALTMTCVVAVKGMQAPVPNLLDTSMDQIPS